MSELITYQVVTDIGARYWSAEDKSHALDQHYDAFGDSEQIISVEAMSNADGTPTEAGWVQIVQDQAKEGLSRESISENLGISLDFIEKALERR